MATTNKMQIHGENMTSVTIIEKILLSMTPKFNYVVRSIKQLKDIEELSIDELHGSMLVYKQKFFQEDKDEQALKASTNNNAVTPNKSTDRGRGRGRGGEENGDEGRGGSGNFRDDKDQLDFQTKGRGRNQQYYKSKVEFRCHKFSHYYPKCYTKLPNNKGNGEKSNFTEKKEVETR